MANFKDLFLFLRLLHIRDGANFEMRLIVFFPISAIVLKCGRIEKKNENRLFLSQRCYPTSFASSNAYGTKTKNVQ